MTLAQGGNVAGWGTSADDRVAWPFYIVCDVSESMHGTNLGYKTPFDAMKEAVVELINFADTNFEASQIAHFGLIAFADETEVVLPLQKMSDRLHIKELPKGKYTDYANVFAELSDVVGADLRRLAERKLELRRPVVFFITDGQPVVNGRGQPSDLWEPPLRRLHALSAPRPEGKEWPIAVVALGFEGTNVENLRLIAKSPGVACVAEAGVASPHALMTKLMKSIFTSISKSAQGGDLEWDPPTGMILCQ